MTTYHVAKWNDNYENNRSRKVKDLAWVPIPNKHDGERYSRLMQRKDAAQIFAAWILILQVASRCEVRGSLLRSDGSPHDSESLSIKTRAPKQWFDAALPVLVEMKWLILECVEQSSLALDCHRDVTVMPLSRRDGDEERREGNGRNGTEDPPAAPEGLLSKPAELFRIESEASESVRTPAVNGHKESPTPKARDPLFDALALAEGSEPLQLTRTAARTIGVALAEIKQAFPDVTPEEIDRRAEAYRRLMPDATLSASALAKHWARCVPGASHYPRALPARVNIAP